MMTGTFFKAENQREVRDYFPHLRQHWRMHPLPNSRDHSSSRVWEVGVWEEKGRCQGSPAKVKVALFSIQSQDVCASHSWAEGNLRGLGRCPRQLCNSVILRTRGSTRPWQAWYPPNVGKPHLVVQALWKGTHVIYTSVSWFPGNRKYCNNNINSLQKKYTKQAQSY